MKMQIINFGVLLVVLSFTSCKNSETVPQETPVTATVPTQVDTTKRTNITSKDTVKAKEKEEKEENDSDEKNEKE